MPILIDGHNLIGRLPTLSLEDPDDEEKLVRLLQSYQARTGKALTVVFDPGEPSARRRTRSVGRIKVVFAAYGSSADQVIWHRVGNASHPPDWLVITSDRELATRVQSLGARVKSADEFALELSGPPDETPAWKEGAPPPEEVEWGLKVFGEEDG